MWRAPETLVRQEQALTEGWRGGAGIERSSREGPAQPEVVAAVEAGSYRHVATPFLWYSPCRGDYNLLFRPRLPIYGMGIGYFRLWRRFG